MLIYFINAEGNGTKEVFSQGKSPSFTPPDVTTAVPVSAFLNGDSFEGTYINSTFCPFISNTNVSVMIFLLCFIYRVIAARLV